MTTGTATACREILIEASPDRIWRVLTVPSERTQWEAGFAEIELRVGGRIELDYGQVRDVGPRVRMELGDFADNDAGQAYREGAGFAFRLFLGNLKSLVEGGVDQRAGWWRGWTGIGRISLEPRHAAYTAVSTGSLVIRVSPGSPAAEAGLQVGDVIVAVNGHPVAAYADLAQVTVEAAPGERLRLGIMRQGGRHDVEVPVGAMPAAKRSGGQMSRG